VEQLCFFVKDAETTVGSYIDMSVSVFSNRLHGNVAQTVRGGIAVFQYRFGAIVVVTCYASAGNGYPYPMVPVLADGMHLICLGIAVRA
jgi:hypothetical protein